MGNRKVPAPHISPVPRLRNCRSCARGAAFQQGREPHTAPEVGR